MQGQNQKAVRARVRGTVQGVGYRDATVRRARELGAMGWVRSGATPQWLLIKRRDELLGAS